MREKLRLFFAAILLAEPALASAELARPAFAPPPPAISSGGIVQIIFSLLLVLAAIVLVAWLLRRMNASKLGAGNQLKVLGGVAIGQRERIVLVEVSDTWLVVGVGPGQIRTLHTLQKQKLPDSANPVHGPGSADNKFANLLATLLHR
ncbi:MAG: flagellar biosynthetic protein FliO [Gallionella sp.]